MSCRPQNIGDNRPLFVLLKSTYSNAYVSLSTAFCMFYIMLLTTSLNGLVFDSSGKCFSNEWQCVTARYWLFEPYTRNWVGCWQIKSGMSCECTMHLQHFLTWTQCSTTRTLSHCGLQLSRSSIVQWHLPNSALRESCVLRYVDWKATHSNWCVSLNDIESSFEDRALQKNSWLRGVHWIYCDRLFIVFACIFCWNVC